MDPAKFHGVAPKLGAGPMGGEVMNKINSGSSSISLALGGVFVFGVGAYPENGGFKLAGCILIVVGVIGVLNQNRGNSDSA